MVLEIDGAKRRVSLGLKQTMRNPWEVFAETHPEGTEVEGEVKNITEFGLFVGLPGDIDGMVHLSDLSWDERGEDAIQNYRKGDMVGAVVSEVDVEKERISLSIKGVGGDKFAEAVGGVKRGSIVTVNVTSIEEGGIEVEYESMKSFIRRSDLSRDRAEQRQSVSRSVTRSTCASPTWTPRHTVWACPSRPAKSPKKKKRLNSMVPPIPAHPWVISLVRR